MNKHPGQIWLKTWPVGYSLHFKVVDNELGEYEPTSYTHIIYHSKSDSWSGSVQSGDNRFMLNSRQAFAMFLYYFNCF